MKKIKFSVVGVGAIADSAHIPGLLNIPNAEIVNICDTNENALLEIGNRYSIEKRYHDFKDALKDDVDAVIIATDAPVHSEITLYALNKKIPVFVEKPMTITVEDAERVYNTSKETKTPIMVGYQLRHMPNHQKVKEYVHSGMIGSIYALTVRAETLVIKPDETLLIDYGTHFYDLIRFYLSDHEIASVYCDLCYDDKGIQIGASVMMKFHDCPFQIVVETYWVPSFNWSDVDRSVTFLGQYGKISTQMSIPEITLLKTRNNREKKFGSRTIMPKEAKNVYMSMGDYAYQRQLEIFVDCLLNNKKIPVDAYDGMMAMKIASAALKSANENKVIEIK